MLSSRPLSWPRVEQVRAPDPAFADPRLAALYDDLDGDRADLEVYCAIVDELGARSVLDVGCGTGSLAVLLTDRGRSVVGVDPATASLDVARTKPLADRVTWVSGDATAVLGRGLAVDLAVMTGNVAQVFVTDDDWHATLAALADVVRPGGWLVFETRRPEARAWEEWDVAPTEQHLPDGSSVVVSRKVTEVALPLVTFVWTARLGGDEVGSTSTLRFREAGEVEADLGRHGFEVVEVRQAPDRPGKEMVFLARRPGDDGTTPGPVRPGGIPST